MVLRIIFRVKQGDQGKQATLWSERTVVQNVLSVVYLCSEWKMCFFISKGMHGPCVNFRLRAKQA